MWTHASNSRQRFQNTTTRSTATTNNRRRHERFQRWSVSNHKHAIRAGTHSTLGSSLGSLVFNRDMLLNIPLIANWHAVTQRQEHLENENLMRENRKRHRHDYAVDQRVLKKCHNPTKLGPWTSGPYRVVQTHVNGTVTIELWHGVTERVNIESNSI